MGPSICTFQIETVDGRVFEHVCKSWSASEAWESAAEYIRTNLGWSVTTVRLVEHKSA